MSGRLALVIDNEPAILALIERVLRSEGWDVASFLSRETALEALGQGMSPDVALVDLWIDSREDGHTLLLELLATRPPLSCVVMSGAVEAADVAQQNGLPLLRKPFDLDDLLAVLDRTGVSEALS